MCIVGFCDQASSWSSSCGWRNLQPTTFLVGDWSRVLGSTQLVSHVLGSRASKGGNCHYRISPIGHWDKSLIVGW